VKALALAVVSLCVTIGCNGSSTSGSREEAGVSHRHPDGSVVSCADAGVGNFLPCDVERVVAVKCRRCHDRAAALTSCLAKNACIQAPFPLDNWSDTRHAIGGGKRVVDYIAGVIERDEMPFKTDSIQPPVESLTADEKSTILDWARACAPASATGCPQTP
jgi:hypothetical protein